MAAGRHNLSRRAVLGAAVGAWAARGGVGPAAVSTDPFALSLSKGSPSLPITPEKRGLRQAQPERDARGSTNYDRWHRILASFRRAQARIVAVREEELRLPPEARAFPACEALEERFNDLECARLAALRRLLRAPAPNLAALSLKLDLAIDDQAWELTDAEPCLAVLKADARRLAHGG